MYILIFYKKINFGPGTGTGSGSKNFVTGPGTGWTGSKIFETGSGPGWTGFGLDPPVPNRDRVRDRRTGFFAHPYMAHFLGPCLAFWATKKQHSVAMSTITVHNYCG